MKITAKPDRGTRTVHVSSLTQLLQIGKRPDPEEEYYDGFFDEQKNYHPNYHFPESCVLTPWEWVVIPGIVNLAKKLGVEVPEDPPVDLSKTF